MSTSRFMNSSRGRASVGYIIRCQINYRVTSRVICSLAQTIYEVFLNLHHVHQRFHAVGHGTFLTGLVFPEYSMSGGSETFSWVYDCGSKSSKALKDALNRARQLEHWPESIDMLVLSHFDDDHVNGLEDLLKKQKVKCLVLPFSEWQQRLREVAVGGTKGISASTAQLQLDPVGWLASRDLGSRVNTLLLIRGGTADPDAPPLDPVPLPLDPDSKIDGNARSAEQLTELRMGTSSGATASSPAIQVLSHREPIRVGSLPMDFMFFNAELGGSSLGIIETVGGVMVAKKSKLPLPTVRQQVETTIANLNLAGSISSLPTNWRAQLKVCYEQHFGSTGQAKNNISLCLYVGPISVDRNVSHCGIFSDRLPLGEDFTAHKHFADHKLRAPIELLRPAVLYTGDLKLDGAVIDAMQSHFGGRRWDKIGVTQVPHHGSTHSWQSGNASRLAPSTFVHCASGSAAHPHPTVTADLAGECVFTADYKNSVTLEYHFHA
jgi:hypothetical protein